MKFNRYFILVAFFMLILSVSTVSAADNTDINDNSTSDLINTTDTVSPDPIAVNKNWTVDEFLNEYSTIQDNDVVFIQNGTGILSNTIILNQNGITIFTDGNVIFDGQRKNINFEITGNNVLIKGITFKNFNYSGNGGAILWNGDNGTLADSNFINNTATNGGAVYWIKANGTVINCTFTDNNATNGGAVYWNSTGHMINCSFANSEWVKSNGIYAQDNLTIEGGNGIVDVVTLGTLSGISITVLNNETHYLFPNHEIEITGKITSGDLTIVDNTTDVFKFYLNGTELSDEPIQVSKNGEYFIPYTSTNSTAITVSANYTKSGSNSKYKNSTLIFNDNPDLKVLVENITYGDNATVNITINPEATGNVNITINGTTYQTNITNGKATIEITNLTPGKYTVTVSYNGDGNFNTTTFSTEFTVSEVDLSYVLSAEDIVKYFRNGTQYQVSLKRNNGEPIVGEMIDLIFVNSKGINPAHYIVVTDENGIATLIVNANPGIYDITAIYGNQSVQNKITVLPITYSITAEDIFMGYNDGTKYTAKLAYSDGNPISNTYISIILKTKRAGKEYKVLTDENGIAYLPIGLNPGQYTMTAKYLDKTITTRLVVLKGNYIISIKDVVKYFKNGTQYAVKVTDLKGDPISGQKVTVTLNSATWKKPVTYTITTDNNGIATLIIGLSPGKYTAKAGIGVDSIESTINVLPTLTIKSLIKPVNQKGDLVAKLVDDQGKPLAGKTITFTVKTKTYIKITDANGIASLPIGLCVGTWNINIADPTTGAKTIAKVVITKAKA